MSFEQQQQQQQPEQIGANKAENVTAGESGMTVQAPNTNGVQRTSSISSDSSAIEPAGPTDPSLPGRFRAAGQWKYSKKNRMSNEVGINEWRFVRQKQRECRGRYYLSAQSCSKSPHFPAKNKSTPSGELTQNNDQSRRVLFLALWWNVDYE